MNIPKSIEGHQCDVIMVAWYMCDSLLNAASAQQLLVIYNTVNRYRSLKESNGAKSSFLLPKSIEEQNPFNPLPLAISPLPPPRSPDLKQRRIKYFFICLAAAHKGLFPRSVV